MLSILFLLVAESVSVSIHKPTKGKEWAQIRSEAYFYWFSSIVSLGDENKIRKEVLQNLNAYAIEESTLWGILAVSLTICNP